MPKKKRGSHRTRKAKAQQARRRPLRAVPGPVGLTGSASPLARLVAPYMQWHATMSPQDSEGEALGYDPVQEAHEVLDAVAYLVETLEDEVGPCTVTDIRPEDLRTLFEIVVPARPDLDDAEVNNLAASIILFLTFLEETGRWTGLPSDLEASRDVARENMMSHPFMDPRAESALDGLTRAALAPDLSTEEEVAGLAGLPLVGRLRTLLDWWGPGRPVTATRAMKLADVVAAAQLFDLQVRTPAGARARQDSGLDLALAERDGPLVRSMWDVRELASLWVTARDAGLLDIQPATARRTAAAALLTDGPPEERLPVLRRTVASYVASILLDAKATMGRFGALVSTEALEVLASSLMHRALSPVDVEDDVCEQMSAPFAEAEEMVNALLRGLLEHFAAMGLLTVGKHYEVPEPVRQSIALSVALVARGEPDDDLADDTPGYLDDDIRAVRDEPVLARTSTKASVFQVKISLKGSRPPVWRRILVPSDIPLDHLHYVIQSCFQWEDSHLHRFATGDPYRSDTVYELVDQRGQAPSPGGPTVVDERTRTLRDVAPGVGSSLTYLYDFGDDWEHVLKVEKVLDPEGIRSVPRLVAGSGHAPHEDSGGVFGWAQHVAAASDPDDPEHEDSRSWLGLEDGEVLDPAEFHLDDVDLGPFRH
jgi:Plasmid pRiA4b ORF-3-like protein